MVGQSRTARISIRMTVVTAFAVATILTAALAIGLQFYFGHALARDAARGLYSQAASGAAAELINVAEQTTNVVELLAHNPALATMNDNDDSRRLFATVLRQNPLFYGIYVGRADGSFLELINLDSEDEARAALQAGVDDRWVVSTVLLTDEGYVRRFEYLDEYLVTRESRSELTDFNAATRPWFTSAFDSDETQTSGVYQFSQHKGYGQTLSRRLPESDSVLGVDVTLAGLSGYLDAQLQDTGAVSFLFTADGQVIASSGDVPGGRSSLNGTNTALLDLAGRPDMHDTMVSLDFRGRAHFAFVTPLVDRDADTRFFGILVPAQEVVGTFMGKVLLSIAITALFLAFLLPLSWYFATPIVRPIRQLADENDKIRRRQYEQVQRVEARVREVDELSESMVNMVNAIRVHEAEQRELMDSFIRLIAQAIDDKSPYTGGHCARVPELAIMLAQQASDSAEPPFDAFSLGSEDEWREFRIAAWLHDCGKITTPEHIVDKGSKLETIYNRVHEVRMRFEVLLRDARIHYEQQLRKHPERDDVLARELVSKQQQLEEDFAFVAQCNVGGEYLDEEALVRLRKLAKITWERHFSDRLGLSPVEELRTQDTEEQLPVLEHLLGDKPEHIIERTGSTCYAPELGINMEVPEHLYNLGEVYNLSVSRGTLTPEDRFKINEHMISTIKMLEGLPFPPELVNVPRYASTHHETMRGSGYPRRLNGDQLSVPERILAVADVFEALTASDRPYKKSKPVSVAVDILHKMVLDEHLDRDCFELFISSKVYLEYAEKFLAPDQIDEVDESRYWT